MGLRKGQKELVEQYRGGCCAVPAIPGGGKTHCLSLWAAEAIASGLNKPGKILIVTYMNSAVNNFKQRISAELKKRGINSNRDYTVSTIHGLCLQIIKEKPDAVSASEEFNVIEGVEKIHIVSAAVDEWKKRNDGLFRHYIDESYLSAGKLADTYRNWGDKLCGVILSAIGDFKCRGITPEKARELCRELPEESILKWAADIYGIYDRRLKIQGFLDFDDMLHDALKMLTEDKHLLDRYRSMYTFVCEDEAQDSNLIQSRILTLIADGNLLRVGDSNQAICGSFTNSDFKFFKEFCELPGTTVYNITQSSRNTRDIIDLANYFVRYVRDRHPVPECRDSLLPQYIEPVDEQDERRNPVTPSYGIKAKVFKSWEEEAGSVVMQSRAMLKLHPGKTIAILAPAAWRMNLISGMLEASGTPFEELDNTSKERNRTIVKLGRIIDFLALPENGAKLAAMMNDCFLAGNYEDPAAGTPGGENSSRMTWRELFTTFVGKYPVEKLLYPLGGVIQTGDIPPQLAESQIWADFTSALDFVKDILEFPETVIEKLILYIAEKLEFNTEERAIAQKVAGDVRYLMEQNPRWRLSDLALELLSPKNMFNHFAGIVWELHGYEPKPGVVALSTYHKAKGLEWDIVFLTGLNYADFPVELSDKFIGEYWFLKEEYKNPQAIVKAELQKLFDGEEVTDSILSSKLETISERARLLYVGITRTREYLFLSGFHANPGRKNETLPSKYLLELMNYIGEVGKSEEQPAV